MGLGGGQRGEPKHTKTANPPMPAQAVRKRQTKPVIETPPPYKGLYTVEILYTS